MIRRRHFTPNLRRRLAELDEKPGLGPEPIAKQASAAVGRFAIIDQETDPRWRALLNEFPHTSVGDVYSQRSRNPEMARKLLEARHGAAI